MTYPTFTRFGIISESAVMNMRELIPTVYNLMMFVRRRWRHWKTSVKTSVSIILAKNIFPLVKTNKECIYSTELMSLRLGFLFGCLFTLD